MSAAENNCKWTFATKPETSNLVGVNEPMTENFKKTPYASLVRESIQNSLDVKISDDLPVIMKFSVKKMNSCSFQEFFNIKEHIKGCIDFYGNKPEAKLVYQPMIDYLERSSKPNAGIEYIQVSDYNTKGMPYNVNDPDDPDSPFVAFVRAAGISTKSNNGAGGSFGFGKAAYFYMSPIRTIMVSTKTESGEYFFEGVASLCTHKYKEETKMAIGYYDANNGYPMTDNNEIPERFKRKDINGESCDNSPSGTDILIMGIKDGKSKDEVYQEMTEAVLRNFWMAIYENKLIVYVGDTIIEKNNLLEIMNDTFNYEEDDKYNLKRYNPIPYLNMVINAEKGEKNHKIIEECNGRIKLYLHKKKGGYDRVLFMRSPRMLVRDERKRNKRGFYGLFVCDGEINELLRLIENPAHDEWDKKNYDKDKQIAKQIEKLYDKYIVDFVRDKIDELFSSADASEDTIKDLEQYLYIPTDIDDEDEEFAHESLVSNPTGEFKDEGSSMTTDTQDVNIPKPIENKKQFGVIIQPPLTRSTRTSENGGLLTGKGGSHKGKGSSHSGTRNITGREYESDDGENKTTMSYVPVQYRTFAQNENGIVVHKIVIHSDYDIKDGRIDLLVGSEDSEEKINIINTNQGEVRDNTIIHVNIVKGINNIAIRFADNLKHSIKLETYEIK